MVKIELKGFGELAKRFEDSPRKFYGIITKALTAALYVLWENVPPYPKAPAGIDGSQRTGTLGRSLGVGMDGGKIGAPSIFKVGDMSGYQAAQFGTNLEYASRVIGENQGQPWGRYWWNIRTIADRASGKIEQVFEKARDVLTEYLDNGRV